MTSRGKRVSKNKKRSFAGQANDLMALQQHSKERRIYPTIKTSCGQDLGGNSAANQRQRLHLVSIGV